MATDKDRQSPGQMVRERKNPDDRQHMTGAIEDEAGAAREALSRALDSPRPGPRLKHARLMKGYTLKALAQEVSCSESMISKLENGKLSPSISLLHRLAKALGTSLAELLIDTGPASDSPGVTVFRVGNRARFDVDPSSEKDGSWFEKILPIHRSGLLQANILNIPPRAKTTSLVQHDGEEFGYMIEGTLEVIVERKVYVLQQGDFIYFSSALEHGYRNTSSVTAKALWVNTPPTL